MLLANLTYLQLVIADEQDKPISFFFPEIYEFIGSNIEGTVAEEEIKEADLEEMDYPNSTATIKTDCETHTSVIEMTEQEKHYSRIQTHYHKVNAEAPPARMLIHCAMGKSRSATSFIMYVMRRFGLSVTDAFEYCFKHRQETEPNEGFMEQLRQFEANGNRFESEL